jgi:hypothetical protein
MQASYPPLSPEKVRALPVVSPAGPAPPGTVIELGSHFVRGIEGAPQVGTRVRPLESENGSLLGHYVTVETRGASVPLRVDAPRPAVRRLSLEDATRRDLDGASGRGCDFLGFRPVPERELLGPAPPALVDQQDVRSEPFPFTDTTFPWSTFGRVTSGGNPYQAANGVMIGPRHVLTSSRIAFWQPDGSLPWLSFAPAYSYGSTPFGTASVGQVLFFARVEWFLPDNRLDLMALDYMVCILDHRLGDTTGWVGSRPWNPAWEGLPNWSMVCYNRDFGDGHVRVYQSGFSVVRTIVPPGTTPPGSGLVLEHGAQLSYPVQPSVREQAGPIFAWWDGEPWPRVVALQTSAKELLPPTHPATFRQLAASGEPLVWLIQQALADFP